MEQRTEKPRLLIISHVSPVPKVSGQNLRVYYSLLAARQFFHVTFLTAGGTGSQYRADIEDLCDEYICLPSAYKSSTPKRLITKLAGTVFAFATGLKFSNFVIGNIELTPQRVASAIKGKKYDVALFEYWHAHKLTDMFHKQGVPCVLDTHNILWQTYIIQYSNKVPGFVKNYHIRAYKAFEENVWKKFDSIIAINASEYDYIKQRVPAQVKMVLMGMGVDLSLWPYIWQPASPTRLAYYGGLGSPHNKRNAIFCAAEIMPLVWQRFPEAEFWMIGSNPDAEIMALQKDPRIRVTGFVENVLDVLKTISIFLCPWQGTYGFRSRIIEVMAAGLPVICSKDAVDGMDLDEGEGIFFADKKDEFAARAISLLQHNEYLTSQSQAARTQVEMKYSFENSYLKGIEEIRDWMLKK